MDGNGRWAIKILRISGHKKGAESVRTLIQSALEFGIHYVSIYAFRQKIGSVPKKK